MKYAFVTLSIIAIWVAICTIINILNYTDIILPITALGLTLIIFVIGFRIKQ